MTPRSRLSFRRVLGPLAALCAALAMVPADAQESTSRTGLLGPNARHSLGLNLGTSDFSRVGCGVLGGCDDSDRYVYLYGRSMASDYMGAELGYFDLGSMARAGGSTSARGINLSLVGRAPFAAKFSGFGKVGVAYGRTSTSALAGSGVTAGNENGFGLSYGLGLSWDFTPRLSAVLEWDSYDMRLAGGAREPVRATSLGLQFRY